MFARDGATGYKERDIPPGPAPADNRSGRSGGRAPTTQRTPKGPPMSPRHTALLCVCWSLACLHSAALQAQAPRKTDRKPAAAQMRTWTDVTGKFKSRASLAGVEGENVRLKKPDGTEIVVALEKLSAADRKWLAAQSAAAPSPRAAENEWPGFRGPNRDGKSPDTGLLKEWPADGPKLLWKADSIGNGFSSVAVAGGMLYITGDVDGKLRLFAFDLEGKPKWHVDHGPAWTRNHPGSRATPTIDGGNLYLLSGVGLLGCFDARTGKLKWTKDAKEFGGSPGGWGYAESVLIYESLAVFKPGGANCIVALDKQSGRPVWTSKGFTAAPEYSSCLAFAHEGVPLIATGTKEGLVCVSAKSGVMAWSNPFAARNVANCPTPAVSDGHLFWANGYGKGGICLRLGPGGKAAEAWTTKDMDCHHGGYVIHEGHIYGNNGRGWTCLELKTGQKKWQEQAVGKGSLCWADGMLYLFSERGGQAGLATCSPRGLEVKGRVTVQGDGPSWAHPVGIGGRRYLRYDTIRYCFDGKAR